MGIDVTVVDTRFSGMKKMFVRVAKVFANTGEATLASILEAWDQQDISRFVIETHGLKSASLSLGMNELSEMAKDFEMLGKAGDINAIGPKIDAFKAEFIDALESLKVIIAQFEV